MSNKKSRILKSGTYALIDLENSHKKEIDSKYSKEVVDCAMIFINAIVQHTEINKWMYKKLLDLINEEEYEAFFYSIREEDQYIQDFYKGVKRINDSTIRWNLFMNYLYEQVGDNVLWTQWFYFDIKNKKVEYGYLKVFVHIINQLDGKHIDTVDLNMSVYGSTPSRKEFESLIKSEDFELH
jgi:hypothetical protein